MGEKRGFSFLMSFLTASGIVNMSSSKGITGKLITFSQTIRIAISLVGTVLSTTSIILSGIKISIPRYAFYPISGGLFVVQTFYLWRFRQGVKQSVLFVKDAVDKRNEPHHILYKEKIMKPILYAVTFLVIVATLFSVCYYLLPIGYDVYLAFYTNSTEPFSMPMPNKGVLGTEHQTRSFAFYSLTLFYLSWSASISTLAVGYYTLLFMLVLFTCNELKIISENVISWKQHYKNYTSLEEKRIYLKVIIRDHQHALRLIAKLRFVFGFTNLATSIIGPLALTLFTYSFSSQLRYNLPLAFINFSCGSAFLFCMFFSCYAGELLQTQGFMIFEKFCEVSWYEMPTTLRKDLNMIFRQAARPMTIHYKGRCHLNLRFFMQMLNSSYSYFMLLNSMSK